MTAEFSLPDDQALTILDQPPAQRNNRRRLVAAALVGTLLAGAAAGGGIWLYRKYGMGGPVPDQNPGILADGRIDCTRLLDAYTSDRPSIPRELIPDPEAIRAGEEVVFAGSTITQAYGTFEHYREALFARECLEYLSAHPETPDHTHFESEVSNLPVEHAPGSYRIDVQIRPAA